MPATARKARERSDNSTEAVTRLSEVTDKMHALLVARADELVGCTENSPEECELEALSRSWTALIPASGFIKWAIDRHLEHQRRRCPSQPGVH